MISPPPRTLGVVPAWAVGSAALAAGAGLLWLAHKAQEGNREWQRWYEQDQPSDLLYRTPNYGGMTDAQLKAARQLLNRQKTDSWHDPMSGTMVEASRIDQELRRRAGDGGFLFIESPGYVDAAAGLWAGLAWMVGVAAAAGAGAWGYFNSQRSSGAAPVWQGPTISGDFIPGPEIEAGGTTSQSLYLLIENATTDYGSNKERIMGPGATRYKTWWKPYKYTVGTWPNQQEVTGYEFHWARPGAGGTWTEGCISIANDASPGVGGCSPSRYDAPFQVGNYYLNPPSADPAVKPVVIPWPDPKPPPLYDPEPVPVEEPERMVPPAPRPVIPAAPPEVPDTNPVPQPVPGPGTTPAPLPLAPPTTAPKPPLTPPGTDTEPESTKDGALVPKPTAPTTTTSPDDHYPIPGAPPVTGNGPRAVPEEMAKELGRLEQKMQLMLNPVLQGPDWLKLLYDFLRTVAAMTSGTKYTLTEDCNPGQDPNYKPASWNFDAPGALAYPGVLMNRMDALAAMVDQSLRAQQKICPPVKPQLTGEWVTVNFLSDMPPPDSKSRMRKVFRYRDQTSRPLLDHVQHWESFVWDAGPVVVISKNLSWGTPQVWAASAEEGKRVIRHAADIAGVDLADPKHQWLVTGTADPRYGRSGRMRVNTRGGEFVRVTSRPGPSGPPSGYSPSP